MLDGGLNISALGAGETLTLAAGITHSGVSLGGCTRPSRWPRRGRDHERSDHRCDRGAVILATGTLILANGGNSYSGSTEVMGGQLPAARRHWCAHTGTTQITIDSLATFAITQTGVTDPTLNPGNRIPDCSRHHHGRRHLSMASPSGSHKAYRGGRGHRPGRGTSRAPSPHLGRHRVLPADRQRLPAGGQPGDLDDLHPCGANLNGPSNLFNGFADGTAVAYVKVGITMPAIYQVANGFVTGLATATTIADGNWTDDHLAGRDPAVRQHHRGIKHSVAFNESNVVANGLTFATGGTTLVGRPQRLRRLVGLSLHPVSRRGDSIAAPPAPPRPPRG